jgi:eukaryotic-like serine/threonine-protein kinase
MLTAHRAFAGQDVTDTIAAIVRGEPEWERLPAETPAAVRRLLRRCLAKDPKARLREAGSAIAEIADAMTGEAQGAPIRDKAVSSRVSGVMLGAIIVIVLAAAAIGVFFGLRRDVVGPIVRFRISLPAGASFSNAGRHLLALSPDGRLLVYGANNQLYVRRLDRLNATPLRGTEGGGRSPFFSPDGRWVGFWAGGLLKKVSVDGGPPATIAKAENPYGATWNEDDTVVFGGGSAGILTVAATGGTPQPIITVGEGELAHGPQILPGGEWVLFTLRTTHASSWDEAIVVVQSLATRERRFLATGKDARYLPTGHLVYASRSLLFATPFDPSAVALRGSPVTVLEGVGDGGIFTGAAHFVSAANGTLAYVPGVPRVPSRVARLGPSGSEEAVFGEPKPYGSFQLSPDGTRIAVAVRDENRDVWIWDLRRGAASRLTFGPDDDDDPIWSRDGSRIIFASSREGGGVFSQRADGAGAAERLVATPTGASGLPAAFRWANDDDLVFEMRPTPEAPRAIWLWRPLAKAAPMPVLADKNSAYGRPAVSPDGRWLAYESNESGRTEVYVRPFPAIGDGKWQVSSDGGVEPNWSVDGRTLYYGVAVAADRYLWSVEVKPGPAFDYTTPVQRFKVAANYATQTTTRRYDIDANGRVFVLKDVPVPVAEGDGAASPHVVVVQNWFEELKRQAPSVR